MTMPMNLHPQYITDDNGTKVSVILPIKEFEDIQNNFEEIINHDTNNDLKELQISSMFNTWDNDKDKGWDEL